MSLEDILNNYFRGTLSGYERGSESKLGRIDQAIADILSLLPEEKNIENMENRGLGFREANAEGYNQCLKDIKERLK